METAAYRFQTHGDRRGTLIALEAGNEIPFPIRRIYYLYGIGTGMRRGCHAHKALKQVLICLHGSCKVMLDDGRERKTVLLDGPDQGLYIGGPTWRELFDFSAGAVVLVLASEFYDEEDYIRDYDQFLEFVSRQKEGGEPR